MNIRQLLALGTGALEDQAEARLEAEILLAFALDKNRAWLYAWPEHVPDDGALAAYQAALQERVDGKPIAYITGHREFWSLDLLVDERVLIPRPETETLVSLALVANFEAARVLDMGTGSGAIALAIARDKPAWQVVATDVSPAALEAARHNAERLGLARVEFRQGAWFEPVAGGERFDLILSNPPYVAEGDAHLSQGDLRFEPQSALIAGADGLADLRQIIATAPEYLYPGRWLMVEHGYQQAQAVQAMFVQAGFENMLTQQDENGLDRVTLGRMP